MGTEFKMDAPNQSAPMAEAPAAYPTNPQRRILWTALTALAATSLLGVAALVFFGFITFLSWSYPILLPIGLAVIIALVLEPVVDFFQKQGVPRQRASIEVCLLAVIGFFLFGAFLLPPLVGQAGSFFQSLPGMLSKGVAKLDASLAGEPERSPLEFQSVPPAPPLPALTNHLTITAPAANQTLEFPPATSEASSRENGRVEIQAWLKTNLPAIQETIQKNIANVVYSALGPVGQAFGFLLGFGFVPIYAYYFLADRERITQHWHEFVPLRRSGLRDEVVSVLAEINTSLVGYFRGQIIVAACNGLLTCIGLWLIGIPYSLVLGIMTGALSIVPFLGIIASIIPALLLGFLSAKNDPTLQWLRPLLVLGVFAGVQMTESMFITPRVQSHSTGLHPLAIILGILFWSMLLPGLLGPIVAVPLTCAMVVLLRRYVWQERAKTAPIVDRSPPASS
jgi:predicted PurR-regulated permease PerM